MSTRTLLQALISSRLLRFVVRKLLALWVFLRGRFAGFGHKQPSVKEIGPRGDVDKRHGRCGGCDADIGEGATAIINSSSNYDEIPVGSSHPLAVLPNIPCIAKDDSNIPVFDPDTASPSAEQIALQPALANTDMPPRDRSCVDRQEPISRNLGGTLSLDADADHKLQPQRPNSQEMEHTHLQKPLNDTSGSIDLQEREKRIMRPITEVQRYDKSPIYTSTAWSDFIVGPLRTSYELEGVPDGWEACVHPEGALYFYNPIRRIYTDVFLCDQANLSEINEFVARLDKMAYVLGRPLPPEHELVLEFQEDKCNVGMHQWCYYYVDNATRTLFWLQHYDITYGLPHGIRDLRSASHIMHGMQRQYWLHCEMFPHRRVVTDDEVRELMSIVTHGYVDQITSSSSTMAYTTDELEKLLSAVHSAKIWVVAHMQLPSPLGEEFRLVHFHGQQVARLDRHQRLYKDTVYKTALISLLSPLLFNAPLEHLDSLRETWIDEFVTLQPWTRFVNRLQSDWEQYVVLATVLLNANTSFMTINDVNPGTPAQIASLASTITSIGSTLAGLLLMRRHRFESKETARTMMDHINNSRNKNIIFEVIAISYSLPYALLMWSMITFLLAFTFECFVNHADTSSIISAITLFLVGICICWVIYTTREGRDLKLQKEMLGNIWRWVKTEVAKLAAMLVVQCKRAMFRYRRDAIVNTNPAAPETRELDEC